MKHKSVCVDGVDVSKCEQITCKDSLNPMCGNTSICCYGRENCSFKQLAHKTQECEELDNEAQNLFTEKTNLEIELKQLKVENEKYQLFIEKLCEYSGVECDSEEQAIRTLSDFASQMYKAKVINDQLKLAKEQAEQKLEKIREICKPYIDLPSYEFVKILQILGEVK